MAIVNHAAVNIRMHVYFWSMVFSRYMPRSGIARSYGSSIFSYSFYPVHYPRSSPEEVTTFFNQLKSVT